MQPTLALFVSWCVEEGQTFCLTSLPYNVSSPHYPLPFLAPSIPNLPKFPIYSLSIYLQSLCLIPFPSPHCHSLALIPVCIFYTDRGSVTTKKTDEANCTSQSNLTTHTHTHILTISTHYFSSTRSLPMNISTGRQHSRQISCRMHITQSSILGALCQQETVRNALPGKKECSRCLSTVGETETHSDSLELGVIKPSLLYIWSVINYCVYSELLWS